MSSKVVQGWVNASLVLLHITEVGKKPLTVTVLLPLVLLDAKRVEHKAALSSPFPAQTHSVYCSCLLERKKNGKRKSGSINYRWAYVSCCHV